MRKAIAQCAAWRRDGLDLRISVNASSRDVLDQGLVGEVDDLLAEYGVPAESLEIEITESTLMADPRRAQQVLERLSARGVRIAVDDFGTGYSSLAYLKRLPIDHIKIDRSFVMNMAADRNDAAIVASTIDLGRSLGLATVARASRTALPTTSSCASAATSPRATGSAGRSPRPTSRRSSRTVTPGVRVCASPRPSRALSKGSPQVGQGLRPARSRAAHAFPSARSFSSPHDVDDVAVLVEVDDDRRRRPAERRATGLDAAQQRLAVADRAVRLGGRGEAVDPVVEPQQRALGRPRPAGHVERDVESASIRVSWANRKPG
jgi:hypothetical protein